MPFEVYKKNRTYNKKLETNHTISNNLCVLCSHASILNLMNLMAFGRQNPNILHENALQLGTYPHTHGKRRSMQMISTEIITNVF